MAGNVVNGMDGDTLYSSKVGFINPAVGYEIKDNKTKEVSQGSDKVTISAAQSNKIKEIEEDVFDLTNEVRSDYGLKTLKHDVRASNAARAHAEDMLKRNYFSHTSPNGTSHMDRLNQAGVDPKIAGENIGMVFNPGLKLDIPELLMEGWINSPEHAENIFNPYWRYSGVGTAMYNNKTTVAQEFYA